MITKTLISAAIVLSALGAIGATGPIAGAAPAGADPNPCGTHPNPFGSLTSRPHEAAPAGAGQSQELDRGIQEALAR